MPKPQPSDVCRCCEAELPPGAASCQRCGTTRNMTWAVMFATHLSEHIHDGITEPMAMLAAMEARPCYAHVRLDLPFIAQQMRLLTKDTTTLARAIVKARSSRTMLEVLETGDTKDKIAVLAKWGPETNAEHVEHKGDVVTTVRHVYESVPPKEGE